jgi:hypothetical protein
MNKIYKVVWNASIGTWIVVSELAKSKTRTGSVSSSSEITGSQNEIVSKEKKFRPKALVLSIISCLAVSHVWADYTNLYGSIIDTSPTISNGIAIGANTGTPATANDSNGLAVGSRANASAADSTALGNYVNATGVNSTVVGGQASAAGAQSIALQNNSDADLVAEGLATGSSFTAVDSASSYSVAIGAMSQVVGSTAAMAIGKNAQVNSGANNATAIGNTATVDTNAVDGVAIGTNSLTSAANSVALGPRSTANVTNSVALGAGSTTTVQSGNSYITNVAASTTNGVVSVGSATNTRRIQNVADGAADSDAVTVAQLKDVNNRAVGNTTALGGGAAYNPATDVYTPPSYTITKTDGTTYTPVNTVSGALTNLNNEVVKPITFAGNTGSSANNLGTTLNITGGGSTAGTYSGNNLKTAVTGNTVNIQMADAPVFSGTVTAGNLTTGGSLNVTGASNLNGGANLNNQKITNLAAGTISSTSTDAVNGSQLNTTNQNVTTAQNTANTAVTNAAAAQNTANTAVTNAAAAQATADKGLNFSVNGGTADNVKLGEMVNFADGTNTTAVYDPATNTYKYNVNDNIALTNAGSLTVGNTKVDNSGLTITGGPSVTTAGINAGNQKITNVTAGTISATSTDAVNGSQLNTTNQNVTTAQNTANTAVTNAAAAQNTANTAVTNAAAAQATADKGLNFSVNGGTADNVKLGETVNFADGTNTTAVYDSATNTYKYNVNDNIALTNAGSLTVGNTKVDNSGLTITGGPSVTTAGINAGNQKITNVAAGTNATDAVNVSQLDALSTSSNNKTDALGNSTANNLGGGASYDSTTGAVSSPTYTVNGNNVNNVGDAITALDKGWTLQSNGTNAAAVKAGDTVDIGTVAGETNLKVTKTGNTIQYGLNRDLNIDSVTAGDSKLDTNGLTIAGGPSVTKTGIDAAGNTISNVAAGTNATDAVNKGQLDALSTSSNNKTDALGNSTANNLGGGSSYDSTTGAVSSPTYVTTKTDGTTVNANNVGDALTNLNNEVVKPITFAGNSGSVDRKLGETLNITGGLTASGSNSNVKTVISGNTVDIQLADAPVFAGKLTANGLDANGEKVTNVGAGTAATDAVNKGQLDALSTSSNNKTDALGNSTANNLGGGASYDSTTGAVSSPTYTVNGNNVNNVGDAITALDKGWTLQSNGTNAAAVKAGDTVDIGTVAGETNLNVTKTGNTIQYGLNRDLNIDSVTAGDSKLDTNGLTIAGGPSVTKTGIDAAGNTISNVAAGTNATDAVNKGQLDHVDNRVTQVTNTTASIFGGGAKANTDGSISNPTYNVAGTSANNVGDALTALDKAVTDAGTAANAGWTVSANGDAATAKKIKPNGKVNFTGDDNLTVAQSSETDNEGNIKVALNKNLKVDSVTTGNTVIDTTGVKVGDNVQLGSTGLIIAGGPSITTSGISAGNKKISNVAAGVSSTDAVNKGQLDSAISSINNNVGALANSAVQYDKNSDGSVNKDSITLAGGANGTTIKNVANGTVAEGSKDAVNGGQLWTVQQQVNKNTGDISNLQTDISNINNGKSGLVQQADKDAAITVGKDTGGTQVNVAGTAGERTVTGVKAGAVTESSKDAVNGSQLNTTNQALVNYLGGGAGYDNITQSFSNPTYNVGDQSYHNVGDAIGALNQADQTLNTKIDNVSNKLEQAFYATNQRIDDVEKRANAGIAAAMALENAPFVAGKYTYAVGAAYHGGENAVGVTLRKTADNGRWSLTGGVAAASQGDPSVRIGISGVID